MSVETQMVQALLAVCPRVYTADDAPVSGPLPYLVYQRVGGTTARYIDGSAADKRNPLVQIETWCATRLEADALALVVEDALCASTVFTADPQGESIALSEVDLGLFGARQDFSLWGDR